MCSILLPQRSRERTKTRPAVDGANLIGLHQPRVDAHLIASFDGLPEAHAPASGAEVELQILVAPNVRLCGRAVLDRDLDILRVEVRPGCSVAATKRTLTIIDLGGPAGHLDFDCAAVAAGFRRRARAHICHDYHKSQHP